MVRLGLVGAGAWGEKHLEKLVRMEQVKVVGVYDPNQVRLREVTRQFSVPPLEPGDFRSAKLDAAVIASPTRTHHQWAMQLLGEGVNVFVEKPLASDLVEAREIGAQARGAGRICQVGHIERFNPAWRGVIGKLRSPMYVETQRLAPFRERGTDVDVALDLMIHDLDLVLSLARTEPARVDAVGVPVLSTEVDMVNARLEFAGGMVCNLTASRVSPETVRKLRLFQMDGYFSVDLANGWVRHCALGPAVEEKKVVEERAESEGADSLRMELESFVRAVSDGSPPIVDAEDGLRALGVALEIKSRVGEFWRKVQGSQTRASS